MAEKWITVPEAARIFGYTTTWIYELINTGKLKARKPPAGRGIEVNEEEMRAKYTPQPYDPTKNA